MSVTPRSLGDRVRDARESEGMSQTEVILAAEQLGVKHPLRLRTLQRIEAGQSKTRKWMDQLRRIFPALR